ncbi:MAG: sigma-54 dependent transcriptional regulator, partial [Hydrotalea sp.]|nr:sigma-54 dependent transcriptional regulator [Hydrotalea sp.]
MADKIGSTAKLARDAGFQVSQVNSISSAMETLRGERAIDLAMVDIKLGIDQFLKQMEGNEHQPAIIACGEEIKTPAQITALNQKYLSLPARLDHFKKLIAESVGASSRGIIAGGIPSSNGVIGQNKLPSSNAVIGQIKSHAVIDATAGAPFVCADAKTRALLAELPVMARSQASVLITGESGTGKEVLAKTIHYFSGLAAKKFHAFNCAAIPEHLLESELFGYEKGAFTGALTRKIGKFEEADGGTLLLDEISEMDLRLQAKLLRVLQEQEIDRLGGHAPIKINVRIVATTNRDIVKHIDAGKFREDLFYRLNVFQINLPALRARKDDIGILADHFIQKYCTQYKKPILSLARDALAKMQKHHFHGNVRELENAMHRAVIMSTAATITAD